MGGLSLSRRSSGLGVVQFMTAWKRPGMGSPPAAAEFNARHSASSAAGQSAATAWKSSTATLSLRQIRWSGRTLLKP
eukprot:2399424-Prymnesium_polylepis.1